FTGWHMIGVMGLFFGTIITVNLVMAFFATSTWTGLVVKNSYVASQHFNEVTAERRRAAEFGWKSEIDYDNGAFTVNLTQGGKPVAVENFSATIGHPANSREDRTVELASMGGGLYSGQTDLAPGMWQADLQATAPDGTLWSHSIRFRVGE
ncbi:MAG: FixH family protein, partial [Nitratireductor sp.]|nr:FixH family protein [Nitratireductor sp.]